MGWGRRPRQEARLATEAAGAADVVDRSTPSEQRGASHRSNHGSGKCSRLPGCHACGNPTNRRLFQLSVVSKIHHSEGSDLVDMSLAVGAPDEWSLAATHDRRLAFDGAIGADGAVDTPQKNAFDTLAPSGRLSVRHPLGWAGVGTGAGGALPSFYPDAQLLRTDLRGDPFYFGIAPKGVSATELMSISQRASKGGTSSHGSVTGDS